MKTAAPKIGRPLLVLSVGVVLLKIVILCGLQVDSSRRTSAGGEQPAAGLDHVSGALPLSAQHPFHRLRHVVAPRRERSSSQIELALPDSPEHSQDPEKNREWAGNNPAAALDWALNAAEGPQRDAVVEAICPQL